MAELLAPAGNIEALEAAIAEGADAIYMGLKSFNARLRTSNFAWNQFEAAVEAVHRRKKKIFVTVNTVMEETETERMYRFLEYLQDIGPDGIIVQDLGIVRMVQEFFPKLRVHASTQMNIASSRAVNLLSKEGVSRVVLSRELSLDEIRAIKENTNSEIEVFVHGALCVSESGLCLFSSFLGGKSANRGMCTQACRRYYTAEGSVQQKHGYFFSPHDLQLMERIPDLVQAGVDSFKIEGRMKSAEYVGSVVSAYRYLLDNWEEDRKGAMATAKRLLSSDFSRSKTTFLFDGNSAEGVLKPDQAGGTGIFLGTIKSVRSGMATLQGGSYDPEEGDSIRLHKSNDTGRESHKIKEVYVDEKGYWIDIPRGFATGDSVYLLQIKATSKRYNRVLPKDLAPYKKHPGGKRLPVLDITPVKKDELSFFPEGIYVQVSTVKDMYAIQGEQPIRTILELNSTSKASLFNRESLPFSKKSVIISLDPFCPQAIEEDLSETIDFLVDEGFKTWIVNNPAHISMLKNKKVSLIAGPYLYTFNRWAVSWLENQDIPAFIVPLETSQKNIEETFDPKVRDRVLLTLFAYPALFRMRFPLPENYDFVYFSDKENLVFKSLSTPDGSFVMPEAPFSVLDRAKKLRSLRFNRILIDLSKTMVRKSDFKQIISSAYTGKPLPETNRFNWKKGFYIPERDGAR